MRAGGGGSLITGTWLRNTLILLGVLFVISTAIYHMFPAVPGGGCRQRVSCLNNLKQIGTAIRMYMQDYDDRFPLASGFGSELDHHTALWGTEGTAFNRRGRDIRYMPELLDPYIKQKRIFTCPDRRGAGLVWRVPNGIVDFRKNGTSYIFNAWYLKRPGSSDPKDRVEVAGRRKDICVHPKDAPLVWDGTSGYAVREGKPAQIAHGDFVTVLYVDGHASTVATPADAPPYNRTRGMGSHFWGAECSDPGITTTHGARGWWYGFEEAE